MPKSRIRAGLLARVRCVSCVSVLALGACASAPPPHAEVARPLSPSEEADMIAAAKQHPIATTYERPRSADALPVAPPRIPDEPAPQVPPAEAQAAPPPRDQVVIVGNDQAPPAATYRWPDTSYEAAPPAYSGYVDSSPYVWVDGAWVARPGVSAYIDTPWVGVGVGRPWGYGRGYGHNYGYPRAWGAPAPYYRRPPVVVRSAPPVRYYDRPTTRSSGYQSSPRREVYVAPRAPSRAPSASRPTYRAPAVAPRSAAPVYRAPSAAPRSSGGGGGRRSVHVR